MPLYEYKCGSCGNVFEVIQKFSDQPLTVHESCGGPLERLISTSALQFKGSGWYVNDYGKGKSKELKPQTESSTGEKSNGSAPAATESSSKSEKSTKSETSTASKSSPSKSESKKSESKKSENK